MSSQRRENTYFLCVAKIHFYFELPTNRYTFFDYLYIFKIIRKTISKEKSRYNNVVSLSCALEEVKAALQKYVETCIRPVVGYPHRMAVVEPGQEGGKPSLL